MGNRLTQDTLAGTNVYAYDIANRLTSVDGVTYTWDNNGNLLSDETSTYTYNYANMLANVDHGGVVYTYAYSGLGDRLQQSIDGIPTNYTLDINAGLTQVLVDGTHTYLYGRGRIAQDGAATEYFLGDALSSVRQLVDDTAEVTLIQSYEPYGGMLASDGEGESAFQFAGEMQNNTIRLLFLRSRFYSYDTGRFTTKDNWVGDYVTPITLNKWLYSVSNPTNFVDPSGFTSCNVNNPDPYCLLNNGGFLDMIHYGAGRTLGNTIKNQLNEIERKGVEGKFLPLEQPGAVTLRLTYTTSIPKDGLSDPMRKRIALGIFMDFYIRYEQMQGLDPRCHKTNLGRALNILFPHCSSFANEDLVSNYLGFIDAVEDENLDSIIEALGGGVASTERPAGYHPVNRKFTSFRFFEIDECGNINYTFHPLPASLKPYIPIESGSYWEGPVKIWNAPIKLKKLDLMNWY